MTDLVLVDTNVFVYASDTSAGFKHERSAAWLADLWRMQTGRTSVQVLNELFVTLTRKLHRPFTSAEAWDDIVGLMAWQPQPLDGELLERAHAIYDRYGISWWDSMIVAAAELQECSTLLSEDLQDGMAFGSVTVRSPFRHGVSEDAPPAYAMESGIAHRHRRPGRPRKAVSPRAPPR